MTEDWVRPVVQWGIRARNPQTTKAFYAQMFNWPIGDGPIMRIPAGVGAPEAGPSSHPMRRASSSSFRCLSGETIAQIADPEGTPIGLVQQ